jgi:membrane associated rhomboid family serine protease
MNIIKTVKKFLRNSDTLTILIAVNIAVFCVYHIISIFYTLFGIKELFGLDKFLAAPSDVKTLLLRPWTIVTYMFFHQGILHLFFNMLWLYWFGRIFRMYFTDRQLVNVYFLGGFAGMILYVFSYNIFPAFSEAKHFSMLLGASAGVLSIVLAISCYIPNYTIQLLVFGRVKLIIIAIVTIMIDIFRISSDDNVGGHIAHIGGAILGCYFAYNIKKDKDITSWFGRFCGWVAKFFKPKPKIKIAYKRPPTNDHEYNRLKNENQKVIDKILDKISKGGYDSLSREEKEILFRQKT